jgi:tetratricopeptide (TPR) repeat protein
LLSVEKFLLGHAGAWDETNVHKATIDYMRGEDFLDPRLELLLGQLRLEATHIAELEVEQRLQKTLALHGDTPLAPRAFLELGRISALLGQLQDAQKYYTFALAGLWETELRASAYLARAQATHEAGDPAGSLVDYESAITLARSPKTRALAHWGRGVAFERSGNLNRALRDLLVAQRIRVRSTAFVARTALDLPDVFFVPAFDEHYYKGLGAMASAEASDVAQQKLFDYQTAVSYFNRYLSEAVTKAHRYVPNARRLSQRCERNIEAIQAMPPEASELGVSL